MCHPFCSSCIMKSGSVAAGRAWVARGGRTEGAARGGKGGAERAGCGVGRDVVARAVFDGRPGHPVYIGSDHLDPLGAHLQGDVGAGRYLATVAGLRTVECGDLATGRDRDLPD